MLSRNFQSKMTDKKAEVEEQVLDLLDKAAQKQAEACSSPNKTEKNRLDAEADEIIKQAEEVLKDAEKSDTESKE